VFDARLAKRISRSFKTRTEARRWRQEAIVAIRHGQRARYSPAQGQTVAQALDALLEGMADGTVLDRSGRRYRAATIRSYKQADVNHINPALGRLRLRRSPGVTCNGSSTGCTPKGSAARRSATNSTRSGSCPAVRCKTRT
jgi:hypothetical protein